MKNENAEKMNAELELLKNKLENDLRDVVGRAKARLVSAYSAALGDEYVDAIAKRQELSEKYKKYIGVAFECATKCGGLELVEKISEQSDEKNKNNPEREKTVKELLARVLDFLETDYYEIVSIVRNTGKELEEVENRLNEIIEENSDEIAIVRERVKNEFRDEISHVIADFSVNAKRLKQLNASGDGDGNGSGDDEVDVPDVGDIDDFSDGVLPFKNGKGTLN